MPEYDSLTGLLSFHRFREEVERLIVGGFATHHVVVYNDFRAFKLINKEYGFSTGDLLLKEFSSKLIESMNKRSESYFSRIVGDCFVLFAPYENIETTVSDIETFNRAFTEEWSSRFPKAHLKIRTGIYVVEPTCSSVSAAVDAADYARKQITDRDISTVKLYDTQIAAKQNLEEGLSNQLDDAFERGHIQVYLQPRVSLIDRTVVGAEALVRWKQEDGTVLLPNEFLPLYERNGKVIDLDLYVFEQVAAFLARYDTSERQHPLFISVNASILHAAEGASPERYKTILENHGIDPSRVQIELAESDVISAGRDARQLFGRLQDKGMQTVLDDFGSNSSTLMTLLDAPVNTIKLDRSFIKLCEGGEQGTQLLKRTIDLIKGLGFRVTCEGVETEAEVEILRKAGCDEGQGYLFSQPLPIEEFECFAFQHKTTPKANADTKE